MNVKTVVMVVGLVILALLLGFLGSKLVGPTQRQDLPESEQSSELDIDADIEDDERSIEGRDITGEEGEVVDGVRVLGPNESTRVEERDYFEGLDEMEGAVPAERAAPAPKPKSEMDRMLEKVGGQAKPKTGSEGATQNPPTAQGSTSPPAAKPAAKPAVERPSDELADILDKMESGQ